MNIDRRTLLGCGRGGQIRPRLAGAEAAVRLGRFSAGVNRLIGLWWLAKIFYPDRFPEDIKALTRDFYTLFYHVTPSAAQIERVLAGRD